MHIYPSLPQLAVRKLFDIIILWCFFQEPSDLGRAGMSTSKYRSPGADWASFLELLRGQFGILACNVTAERATKARDTYHPAELRRMEGRL
ncbi:MAG: hypothetical protein ACI97A_003548 [Planctomycetota bacterium]|jgi:hypothetical protein